MIYNKIVFCFSFFLSSITLLAQQNTEDVVYLKNGSIVKGQLVSLPNEPDKVKIESQGNTWVFNVNEVENIVHNQVKAEESSSTSVSVYNQPELTRQKSGFYNITDIGLLCGKNGYGYNENSFSLNIVNGYQINEKWSTGVGVGVESMDDGFFPVFLDGRYNLWDKEFSPFIAMQAGYTFPFQGRAEGGILLNPMIGFRNFFSHKSGLNFSLGYRFQKATMEDYYYDGWGPQPGYIESTTYYHRFNIRFGFIFN